MPTDIKVPDLGDFKDVEVIDVLVKPGDQIDVDTPLISIETEKATMDVPSTAAGVVTSLALKKGDRVSKGSLIGQLEAKMRKSAGDPEGWRMLGWSYFQTGRFAATSPPAKDFDLIGRVFIGIGVGVGIGIGRFGGGWFIAFGGCATTAGSDEEGQYYEQQ